MFNEVYNALLKTGISNPLIYLAQIAHETGNTNFSSRVSRENKNFSGIKFAKQAGATKGLKVTEYGHSSYYANFDTVQAWANSYYKILKRIGALTAENTRELAEILKVGKYYEAPVSEYLNGLNYFYTKLKAKLLATEIIKTVEKNKTSIFSSFIVGLSIAVLSGMILKNGK